MNDAVQTKRICSAQSITMPSGGDVHIIPPPPKPCVTIVVHGVNDLAGCYERIERGLCQGLNERLDMPRTLPNGANNPGFLMPATYSLPADDDGKATNPDAVYYRRNFGASSDGCQPRSVVIPFYWGFREEEEKINKTKAHGEWEDRNGNRLDKAGTKEGGQFANATTNLPDMWGKGFNGMLFGFISINKVGGSTTHPLFSAANRRYMVLAAMRLAMLIKIIRKRYPNDTVNVVGHSQGTLLTLLAHAFLKDEGERPVDGFVMLNSPYSLCEPFTESFQTNYQQTTEARIATLNGILQFISGNPNSNPALSSVALKNRQGYGAIGGPGWTGSSSCEATIGEKKYTFNERDNRGCTYLYFTPQDQTVGLGNVQGIGWQGVGDEVNKHPARKVFPQRFHQRIFTLRQRNGQKEKIGLHVPPYVYPLILDGETPWEDTGLSWWNRVSQKSGLKKGTSVVLTAAQLPDPIDADFTADGSITAPGEDSKSGVYQITDKLDPIDASIGVGNDGWRPKDAKNARQETMDEKIAFKYGRDNDSVEKARNEGKQASESAHVFVVRAQGNGMVLITRGETPYEARMRLQGEGYKEALSFHSAIPNNPEHSRKVLAYDVAIGAGESVDDATFYAYLCRVADWRLDWKKTRGSIYSEGDVDADLPDEAVEALYLQDENKSLIDSTVVYRTSGKLPDTVNDDMPHLVATQTVAGRIAGNPVSFGGRV